MKSSLERLNFTKATTTTTPSVLEFIVSQLASYIQCDDTTDPDPVM